MEHLKSFIDCVFCIKLNVDTATVAPIPEGRTVQQIANSEVIAESMPSPLNDIEENQPVIQECCFPKTTGILYATPSDACRGAREKFLFVTCPNLSEPRKPDALMTVDVNPLSKTYCQVICKLDFEVGDEVHHTGWNACASCYGKKDIKRTNLIVPCLHTSKVYVVDTENPAKLNLVHVSWDNLLNNALFRKSKRMNSSV